MWCQTLKKAIIERMLTKTVLRFLSKELFFRVDPHGSIKLRFGEMRIRYRTARLFTKNHVLYARSFSRYGIIKKRTLYIDLLVLRH